MKKNILKLWTIFFAVICLIPGVVMAESKGNPLSVQEACSQEGIQFDHPDYKNNQEGKINLYLFRGEGCSHCYEFLTYLDSIIDDYGKYINIITYETWKDSENNSLAQEVGERLNTDAGGVPFIIIGEKAFSGYSASMNEELQNLIKEEYEKEDRVDVLKELGANTKVSNKVSSEKKATEKTNTSDIIILVIVVLVFGGITYLVVMARKQN